MSKESMLLTASMREIAGVPLADLRMQAVTLRAPIALASAFYMLVLGTALLLHVWRGVPVRRLMQDPAAFMGVPAYVCIISTLGVIPWMLAAVARKRSASKLITYSRNRHHGGWPRLPDEAGGPFRVRPHPLEPLRQGDEALVVGVDQEVREGVDLHGSHDEGRVGRRI